MQILPIRESLSKQNFSRVFFFFSLFLKNGVWFGIFFLFGNIMLKITSFFFFLSSIFHKRKKKKKQQKAKKYFRKLMLRKKLFLPNFRKLVAYSSSRTCHLFRVTLQISLLFAYFVILELMFCYGNIITFE